MKRTSLAALLLTILLAPAPFAASAGGLVPDLPRLSFPDPAPVNTTRTCLEPTRITQACTAK